MKFRVGGELVEIANNCDYPEISEWRYLDAVGPTEEALFEDPADLDEIPQGCADHGETEEKDCYHYSAGYAVLPFKVDE